MKKILLFAAAMLAFAGCKEVDPVEPPVPQEPDEISVSPKSGIAGGEGGKVTTTVTSNGEWTLATAGGQHTIGLMLHLFPEKQARPS